MRRSTRLLRSSGEAVVTSRASTPTSDPEITLEVVPRILKKRSTPPTETDAYEASASDPEETRPSSKKRKTAKLTSKGGNGSSETFSRLFRAGAAKSTPYDPCTLPQRRHSVSYHRPLMLDQPDSCAALLRWFDNTSTTRGMPWRKSWIDPTLTSNPIELRGALEKRAYEVWISEIMLQQTRVAVVIDYWNRWMAKWPTIQELAAASPEDVLAMWRGLGYYSRATRIHEAAKLVCADEGMKGLLPSDVVELQKKVPGVGRYTAGAITAIVFGKASAMVDGNVLRVLSRQLGVLGDVKTDKVTIDMLWMAADALVRTVADDGEGNGKQEHEVSDRPGRWGQALMELGSTICTPKPNCATCPITTTCRAYAEGVRYATERRPSRAEPSTTDIEDLCTLCKPFEEYAEFQGEEDDEEEATKIPTKSKSKTVTNAKGSKRQASLQSFFFAQPTETSKAKPNLAEVSSSKPDTATLERISSHARKFPVKTIKKAVREEETLVCAIRLKSSGEYLIQKRPEKGLLAGLWEFPSHMLPGTNDSTSKSREGEAMMFVNKLVGTSNAEDVKHVRELGSIPWLFSHIKLTMHVHLFLWDGDRDFYPNKSLDKRLRWTKDVETESMGTGMRKCWSLVKDNIHQLPADF